MASNQCLFEYLSREPAIIWLVPVAVLTTARRAGRGRAATGARAGHCTDGIHNGADQRPPNRDAENMAEGSGETRGGGGTGV